jgi:hypothetical protein
MTVKTEKRDNLLKINFLLIANGDCIFYSLFFVVGGGRKEDLAGQRRRVKGLED